MDHAKKYVLVDPQMYRPSLPEKSLSGLDLEIRTILDNDLPDDQKAIMYTAALKKFKTYDNNTKIPEPKHMIASELTDTLPPNLQYKVKKLWRLVKDNPDIDWSDKGELIYKQSLIPNSHVSDLFSDALASKRSLEGPIGWEEFDDVLDSSKVPTTLAKRRGVKRLSKTPKRQGEPTRELPDSSEDSLTKRRKAKKKQAWIKN